MNKVSDSLSQLSPVLEDTLPLQGMTKWVSPNCGLTREAETDSLIFASPKELKTEIFTKLTLEKIPSEYLQGAEKETNSC